MGVCAISIVLFVAAPTDAIPCRLTIKQSLWSLKLSDRFGLQEPCSQVLLAKACSVELVVQMIL